MKKTVLFVMFSAALTVSAGSSAAMSYERSGPSSAAAADDFALFVRPEAAGIYMSASTAHYLEGLPAGAYTFSARYRSNGFGATFALRRLTVIPLP